MKSKTFLFVDGSNLYAGQYELFGPEKYINFTDLIKNIERNLKISFTKIYFYASYSPKPERPTRKQKLYLKNEALFYKSVKSTPEVVFFKGYRSKTSSKEKEVDVKLAVDMVDFAHRNYFDHVFLMSGDADFMQALFTVRRIGKKISVLCLENKIVFKALIFFDTRIIVLKKHPVFRTLSQKIKNNIKVVRLAKNKFLESL